MALRLYYQPKCFPTNYVGAIGLESAETESGVPGRPGPIVSEPLTPCLSARLANNTPVNENRGSRDYDWDSRIVILPPFQVLLT